MKNVFKTGLFYFIAFSMVLGNSIVSIDFSTPIAHAEDLGSTVEYTICHATGSSSNPYTELHVSENSFGGHFDNNGTPTAGHESDILYNYYTSCPDNDPYPVPDVSAQFDSNGDVLVEWAIDSDGRFYQYKVIVSETNPSPDTLMYPDDGYMSPAILSPDEKSRIVPKSGAYNNGDFDGTLDCGETYWFSVTARYTNDGVDRVNIPGNTEQLTVECEEPEPYPIPVMVSAEFDTLHENIKVGWIGTDDERLDGYNLYMSTMDPFTATQGGGPMVFIDDGSTEFDFNYNYECDTTYYFFVKSLYDGHAEANQFVSSEFAVSTSFACEELEEYAPWCSVLHGLMKEFYNPDSSAYQIYNDSIDLNGDLSVNLIDVGLLATMYYEADNDACYAELNFSCEDYTTMGWCGALLKGVDDFYGSNLGDDNYQLMFDLDKDDTIGLSDLSLVATLMQDSNQVTCYNYLVPPLPVMTCDVSDNIPVITLIGDPIINIDHNSAYTDERATADDVEDGNLTSNIVTVNPVDTSVSGTYVITYNVVDSDTNSAVEVTRTVIVGAPYAPWCSALLGAMRDYYREGTSAYRIENDVIDLDNKNGVNLTDLGLLATMYFAGDDDECYAQFENPTSSEREFYFQCEDKEVGWCGGLIQGIKDSYGSSKGDIKYFHVFDLNDDGAINLIDLGLATTLYFGEDQSACYPYYVPPFLMCVNPDPVCGDGNLNEDLGETCDDGNLVDGDGCSASCQIEYNPEPICGNNIVEEGEACDDGEDGSSTCSTQCEVIQTGCVGSCGGGTVFNIRDLDSSVSCSAFDISWRTTKNSDTILDLGVESGVYTENIDNDTNTKNHSLELTDLLVDTTYYYQVRAISSTGLEKSITEKSFTTPPAEQCGEVLGEKIEDIPLICDFLRPSGSVGGDLDVDGVFQYPNGSLLRDACVPGMPVYLIKDQKKLHIVSWQNLHDHYFGQRIYNVISSVVNSYENWTGQVLGTKVYADGSLLRGSDMKVYRLEKGQKQHINTLEKLAKYAGQEIINISDEVLNRY